MGDVVVITTRIDSDLHAAAKRKAKQDGRSLASYLRRLIEQDISTRFWPGNGLGNHPSGYLDGRAILSAPDREG